MTFGSAALVERPISFGPFRLLPVQRVLLEGDVPVRLGGRALDILVALVERPGELVGKNDLLARVWPGTLVDDNTLRVHVAALRRVLGDGQPGRRFVVNIPGRGYQFSGAVDIAAPQEPAFEAGGGLAAPHNLPLLRTRPVGRERAIATLAAQLPNERFVTLVGAGGIGKTTVALALAERLLPAYEHGVWFVDLAPLGQDPALVASALASAIGVATSPGDPAARLIDYLKGRQLLILLDNCEHVIDMAAVLAEGILARAPGVHLLATSREPLRADGEHVHRLVPLEAPPDPLGTTAAQALAYSAVQLFVERGKAIVEGFELGDADAPVVSEICARLGGVALAIELAAARLDAFDVRQLLGLLNDRFQILNRGRRTADPRHRSLAATLDWSFEYLPAGERAVFRRLSLFAGAFTLDDAMAVADDGETDVLDAIANLVTKSLVATDVGDRDVRYRLLEPTRAYALQKLKEAQEQRCYAERHARYFRHLMERAESEWMRRPASAWREDYGRALDDVRSALNWAFSPEGDRTIGVALTTATIPLWTDLSLMEEICRRGEQAWAAGTARPLQESKLLAGIAMMSQHMKGALPGIDALWTRALQIVEELGDIGEQGRTLAGFIIYRFHAGDHRGTLELSERLCRLADLGDVGTFGILGDSMSGSALFALAEYEPARRRLAAAIERSLGTAHYMQLAPRISARIALAAMLWAQGFPDQAIAAAQDAVSDARTIDNDLLLCSVLAQAYCPIALLAGDWDRAETLIATLLDLTTKHGQMTAHALGACWKGQLLVARGDTAGIGLMQDGLRQLRQANFRPRFPLALARLASALAGAGYIADARVAIDEAIAKSEQSEELWSLPELLRVRGEIARWDGAAGAAEDWFLQALEMARRHGSRSWELRAAISLAGIWKSDGRAGEALTLLADIHGRFTEGFDTMDVKGARLLIGQLSER